MHTFAQNQKPTKQAKNDNSTTRGRAFFDQSDAVRSSLRLQHTMENDAGLRLRATAEEFGADSISAVSTCFSHDLSRIPVYAGAQETIRPKLTINIRGDVYEQEADRLADQVLRMPEPQLQRTCSCGEDCTKCRAEQPGHVHQLLQTIGIQANSAAETVAPLIVHEVLRSPGQSLDSATKAFFEPRFGANFGSVRVHSDSTAAESARMVNSLAYTVGDHVAFAHGQYAPGTPAGRGLLAHELTHVVQQRDAGPATTLNRQTGNEGGIIEGIIKKIKEDLIALGNKPLGPSSGFTEPGCPPTFCQPFANKDEAVTDLENWKQVFIVGISREVSAKVAPLWKAYLEGGSGAKDLTAEFGKDFTASLTTAKATADLLEAVRKDVEAAILADVPINTPGWQMSTPWTSAALEAIGTPGDSDEMNFDIKGEVAGNLAGAIGTNQRTVRMGAKPSPWDDLRGAKLTFDLKTNPNGSITVTPSLEFVVQDTIDLCPGDCGDSDERVATVALSRFEATGLTGDVPFVIRFPAPPEKLVPFVVPANLGPTP